MKIPVPSIHRSACSSPIGELLLVADAVALRGVWFADQPGIPDWAGAAQEDCAHALLRQAVGQLAAYFAGSRREFDLPLQPAGSGFQQQVWRALAAIPPGTTLGYGELARTLGGEGSARAVGSAVARNPLLIVLPCHRVIGAGGQLGGYSGGLDRKRWLLAHEGRTR